MNEREELEKARNLGRDREVYAGLPPNAQEVPAPDRGEFPLLRRADEVNLNGEMDGQVWAREFCRLAAKQGHNLDYGWMIGWFVNAIMTGYDAGSRLKRAPQGEDPPQHVTDGSPCWCGPETVSVTRADEEDLLRRILDLERRAAALELEDQGQVTENQRVGGRLSRLELALKEWQTEVYPELDRRVAALDDRTRS